MKPKEVFGIIIRTIGVLTLLYGLTIVMALGAWWPRSFSTFLHYVAWLALSLWFIRGAPSLVRFAYQKNEEA